MSDVTGAGTAISGVATAAGSIASATIQANAAKDAASTYTNSANRSADLQQSRYQTTRDDLNSYDNVGKNANILLTDGAGSYANNGSGFVSALQNSRPDPNLSGLQAPTSTAYNSTIPQQTGNAATPQQTQNSVVPGSMTQAQLEATPGYQFTRDQGLQATQNSASARGLGVSGAAMKGAASYATGLADNTYQNQFNILQTQYQDQLNRDSQGFGQAQNIYTDQYNNNQQNFSQGQQQYADQYAQGDQAFNQGQTQYTDAYNKQQGTFNQQQQNFTNILNTGNFQQSGLTSASNRLAASASLGENAAAQTGSAGAQAATASGNYLTSAGAASGNALLSGANATSSGINGVANAISSYANTNSLLNNSSKSSSNSSEPWLDNSASNPYNY